jgi:phosphoribosylaminoimidazole-succinocarboxamide synthase
MPDDIPFKGESLCRMATHNFQELEKKGIKTHFVKALSPKEFQVKTVRIQYPQKGEIQSYSSNFLIPLEIIFRNSLPKGSSMLKRLQSGSLKPEEVGLKAIPAEGEKLEKPIVDYTTKLEPSDRHLTKKESRELALLKPHEMERMERIALAVNDFLNRKADSIGLEHADGKIEMAFTPHRELMLVDTFGTLDEDRFLFNGIHLSKQVLRDYYARTQWQEAIEKKESGQAYELGPPEKLPAELLQIASDMYKSVCEAWIGKRIWNARSIEEVVHAYREFMEKTR